MNVYWLRYLRSALAVVLLLSFNVSLSIPDMLDVYPRLGSYYYHSLSRKIEESTSLARCSLNSAAGAIEYRTCSPPADVQEDLKRVQSTALLYQANSNLCTTPLYMAYTKKFRACFRDPKRTPFRAVAHFHADHPRCHGYSSLPFCRRKDLLSVIRPRNMLFTQYPFLINASDVLVSRSGMLISHCGDVRVGLFASCKALSTGVATALRDSREFILHKRQSRVAAKTPRSSTKEDMVFVASQFDDTQIGQFFLETFPRILYHLDFLLANPHIKIHYGFSRQRSLPHDLLSYRFLDFVGINRSRLVSGPVLARTALVPREGGCQDAVYNTWELHVAKRILMRFANVSFSELPSTNLLSRPSVLVLHRTISAFTQNLFDVKRRWPSAVLEKIVAEISSSLNDPNVKVFSDSNSLLMECISCQVRLFSEANIVIGVHGAGMMNTLFMKPGSVVVEIVPIDGMDSRHVPLNGIFHRLSSVAGLHHMTFMYNMSASSFPSSLLQEVVVFLKKIVAI